MPVVRIGGGKAHSAWTAWMKHWALPLVRCRLGASRCRLPAMIRSTTMPWLANQAMARPTRRRSSGRSRPRAPRRRPGAVCVVVDNMAILPASAPGVARSSWLEPVARTGELAQLLDVDMDDLTWMLKAAVVVRRLVSIRPRAASDQHHGQQFLLAPCGEGWSHPNPQGVRSYDTDEIYSYATFPLFRVSRLGVGPTLAAGIPVGVVPTSQSRPARFEDAQSEAAELDDSVM